jgi:hypothetical protein
MTPTPDALWAFIESSRLTTGKVPRLRECVEHFDGKTLNVLMCLSELSPARADAIRQAVRDQSRAEHEARNKRRIHLTGQSAQEG